MAGMAEEFMTNWQSKFFRDRIISQIQSVKKNCRLNPHSEDQMEQFLEQNTPEQLEEFIFKQSKTREDYLSLTADLLLHARQANARADYEGYDGQDDSESPQASKQAEGGSDGATPNGDAKKS
ncbi:mediator of RNA polymerase II transcription subunit 15-like [Pomacea canaliculata]|uniref:mediator of RNA polymerase II transcription subunit 15-like n=1 Tax=Pomacea canaliculata TaxID=400727 RepID=UPI000D72F95B|nr:mediator of RNA polymerase II transcription subunit 15-like [Pomacea canaliculata]XP_025091376.1 mediator of RNA polymerase II transcription subunit 15-like [Pomacea canaliculata]XP_025091377.1 mediator of RNA polymerase II transcription subunit 15-like [Pomacea canaliculata]XP_025091378.1 mediator of RNA polymerase II transcription subunit 15-like [Pomacea canaliculata]